MVKDKVDWYLDELVHEMKQRVGKLVSIPTLWRSLQFCGITRKKIQKAAKERSEALRGFYLYNIGINYTSEQLILLMKQLKMREHLPGYMVTLPLILEQKKVLYLLEENVIPFCLHCLWKVLLPLILWKEVVIRKDFKLLF